MCGQCDVMCREIAQEEGLDLETVIRVNEAMKVFIRKQDEAMIAQGRKDAEDTIEALRAAGMGEIAEALEARFSEIEQEGDILSANVVPLDGSGEIPNEILSMLVAAVGGPVVVVAASPREDGMALVQVRAGGASRSRELAERLLESALETVRSPLSETGGVTEDGRIVFPMTRGEG